MSISSTNRIVALVSRSRIPFLARNGTRGAASKAAARRAVRVAVKSLPLPGGGRGGFGDALGLEPALRIDGRLAPVGGSRDGLSISVVVDIAGHEHPVDLRAGLVVDDEVALLVDLEPVTERVGVGFVSDGQEEPVRGFG